jgi:hypothetical protein
MMRLVALSSILVIFLIGSASVVAGAPLGKTKLMEREKAPVSTQSHCA